MSRRGFSLLELSMVLLVSGLMLGFLTQMGATVDRTECYTATRAQLPAINEAIQRFARKNDRLPMPAARNIGVEDINYGREALAAAIDQAGGVSFGALPFQALGLSPSMAGDCWGNKFTYMVTTALTTNASSGGYLDSTVEGNISRKNNGGGSADTKIAYVIVSHGMDELGAVELNYTGVSKGWCGGASNLKTMNCLATIAEFADAVFNDGKDALAGAFKGPSNNYYFDDLVLAAGKPKILNDVTSNIYCWGDNTNGQIGDGTTTQRKKPTVIKGTQRFKAVTSGGNFSCGLNDLGEVYCWGDNTNGQIGDGTSGNTRSSPTLVTNSGTTLIFNSISAGSSHVCGIITTGATYCWGYNFYGQIGDASNTMRTSPVLVAGGHSFTSVSAGGGHTCAINTAGAAYCWGYGLYGQLGDGFNIWRNSPVAVTGGLSFKTVTAGGAHSCGLIADGTAYCWGRNASYQLGDNTNIQRDVPTPVSGGLYFTSIYGSSEHSCGIATTGSSYCWGYNADGQLGDTSNTTRQVPTLVSGGYTFAGIGDGGSHTCASTLSGTAYCWGQNVYAQVGDNSNFNRNSPVSVNSSGTYPYLFSQISSGIQHTCAIAEPDYSLRLTSIGHYMGFLKDDGSIWYRTSATGWTKLSSGSDAFVDIAGNNVGGGRKADGSVYKWTDLTTNFGTGYKRYASSTDTYLAIDGSETAYYQYSWFVNPWTAFSTGARYKDIFGGYGHFCAITIDGTMHCWGGGCVASGCLGNGTTGAGIPVLGGSSWIKGNATRNSTCGIQRDSTLWCWGSNTNGEVGAGDTSPHNSPTQVGVLKWKSISGSKSGIAGSYPYFCGVTVDGDGYCWGYTATNGNLGSNVSNYASTPQKVIGGYKWLHIAATAFEACGITTSKQIYCWGGADYWGGGMGGSYGYTPLLQVGVP